MKHVIVRVVKAIFKMNEFVFVCGLSSYNFHCINCESHMMTEKSLRGLEVVKSLTDMLLLYAKAKEKDSKNSVLASP
jgi:hypothetical protein